MGINGARNAGFAKQVKHRMGRSICKVSDCIGIDPFEAIVRMEARDLKFLLKSFCLKEGLGDSEKVVEIDEILKHQWVNDQRGVEVGSCGLLEMAKVLPEELGEFAFRTDVTDFDT